MESQLTQAVADQGVYDTGKLPSQLQTSESDGNLVGTIPAHELVDRTRVEAAFHDTE